MESKEKPIVTYNPDGESGNIFYILGMATVALAAVNAATQAREMRRRVTFTAKDYDEARAIIGEYVTLKEQR